MHDFSMIRQLFDHSSINKMYDDALAVNMETGKIIVSKDFELEKM